MAWNAWLIAPIFWSQIYAWMFNMNCHFRQYMVYLYLFLLLDVTHANRHHRHIHIQLLCRFYTNFIHLIRKQNSIVETPVPKSIARISKAGSFICTIESKMYVLWQFLNELRKNTPIIYALKSNILSGTFQNGSRLTLCQLGKQNMLRLSFFFFLSTIPRTFDKTADRCSSQESNEQKTVFFWVKKKTYRSIHRKLVRILLMKLCKIRMFAE